jgi:hypothetical protein
MLITEVISTPTIVIDVQPTYTAFKPKYTQEVMRFLNKQTGPILMFVNADSDGLTDDSIPAIKHFWEIHGFRSENWDRVTIDDKGYGYLRGWMDQGVSDDKIITVIREMYRQRVDDMRELFNGEDSDGYAESMYKLLDGDIDNDMLIDPISVGWTEVAQLKKFNGAYVIGGGRDECLKEVTLLMSAFNIKGKLIDSLIYSGTHDESWFN